jgi:hypothetical protein
MAAGPNERVAPGLSVEDRNERRGGRKRTLADILLIAVWVAGYAVVLWAFRVAKALEGRIGVRGRSSSGSLPGQGS